MTIKLSKPFAANSAVDEFDVRQIKKTLNRLGYYQPYEKTGITGIPDSGVFAALKTFQKDQGLKPTGTAKPGDDTVNILNKETSRNQDGYYVWHTVGDDKVRPAHAALSGTVRAWSESPDPGDDYNCRCWAVPVQNNDGLIQEVTSSVDDASGRWGDVEFLWHFYFGNGTDVTLPEIGLLGAVIEHAKQIMFDNVLIQVADRARQIGSGAFTGSWNNSYDFQSVVYSLGGVTIRGRFGGTVSKDGKSLNIEAHAEYEFYDEFTDPLNIRQKVLGTSGVAMLPASLLGGAVLLTTDLAGTVYRITGQWETKITGSISVSE